MIEEISFLGERNLRCNSAGWQEEVDRFRVQSTFSENQVHAIFSQLEVQILPLVLRSSSFHLNSLPTCKVSNGVTIRKIALSVVLNSYSDAK